jgi:hypothetical protein
MFRVLRQQQRWRATLPVHLVQRHVKVYRVISFVRLLYRLFTHLGLLVAYTSTVYPAVGVYDGSGTNTYLQGPIGVTMDSNGNIYISDMHSVSANGIIKVMNTLGESLNVFGSTKSQL